MLQVVLLYCKLYTVAFILAMVYIASSFSTMVLRQLLSFISDKPDVPLHLMGDFNGYIDTLLEKHPG